MNYDTMPAGVEMDGAICSALWPGEGDWFVTSARSDHVVSRNGYSFMPSTSIKDAWEVVEVLDSEFCFSLSSQRFGGCSPGTVWRACCQLGDIVFDVVADTAPLAICRVALLAAGK